MIFWYHLRSLIQTINLENLRPHLLQPVKALSEFYRVLRFGGKITIAHRSGSDQVNAIHSRIGWPVARDFLPRACEMVQLLTQTGFHLLAAEESDTIYFVQAQKQAWWTVLAIR